MSSIATYGWGCMRVTAQTGDTEWSTVLIPKHGRHLVPLRAAVRKAEGLEVGDTIRLRVAILLNP